METILGITTILLFAYSVFKDVLYHRHLEKLEQKLLARNLTDYKVNTTSPDPEGSKNKIAEPDNLVDLDQVPNPFLAGIWKKPMVTAPATKN